MPKELIGMSARVAQMGDKMYARVVDAANPERALKNEVFRVREVMASGDVGRVLGGVYAKLDSNERTARVAGYMKDLYGVGSRRLFVPKASAGMRGGSRLSRAIELALKGTKTVQVVNPVTGEITTVKAAAPKDKGKTIVVANKNFPNRKQSQEESDHGRSSGGGPGSVVNLRSVAKYCLETASHYDEVKPVYDMLMELYYNVPDEEWDKTRIKIKARMRELEQKPRVVVSDNATYVENQQVVERTAVQPKDRRKNPTRTGKIVSDVYEYIYYSSDDAGRRIAELHRRLTRAGWIDRETKVEKFEKLFSGVPDEFHIKWMGAHADLCALIKCLLRRGLIKCPAGATQWVIARSHFKNKAGTPFSDWNRQKDNQKTQTVIEMLADILDPAKAL